MTYPNTEGPSFWDRCRRCPKCYQTKGNPCVCTRKNQFYELGDKLENKHKQRKFIKPKRVVVKRDWRCLKPKPGLTVIFCMIQRGHKSNHKNGNVTWAISPTTRTANRSRS